MKEQLITEVQQQMLPYLNNEQLQKLREAMEYCLHGMEIITTDHRQTREQPDAISAFIVAKRIEGCSEKTLNYYQKTIDSMVTGIGKTPAQITTDDLRRYLTEYQVQRKSSRVTIDNIRRILSTFFTWLEDEDYIVKSPIRRIHKVKTAKILKDTYTDEALELMRDNCGSLRDLAIVDLLASSGMRVGEMVALNRDDINFAERECVVFGKGSKERLVYFDARTKIHLQNYLDSRTDNNPALFVTLRAPHDRLMIGGVESRLRELGRQLNLPKVHPHKFRRTLATSAIDKGMPIEQVQRLLGHQQIDTTMHYAMVNQNNVKNSHRKYIA
jgi:site-specific recombinase XerD